MTWAAKNPPALPGSAHFPLGYALVTLPGTTTTLPKTPSQTDSPGLFPPSLLQGHSEGSVPAAFCWEVSHAAVGPGVNRQKPLAAAHNPQSPGSLHKLARLCATPSPVAPAHQWQHLSRLSSTHNNCLCPACDVMGTSVLPPAPRRCPSRVHCMGRQRCEVRPTEMR